jgi:ribonuclease HII
MLVLMQCSPQYNLGKHKGYGTAEHVAAIFKHGPSPIHRMTFAPIKGKFQPHPLYKSVK